jgi:hypothetical protein
MFPTGSAGVGLLLLRISTAGVLILVTFALGPAFSSHWAIVGLALLVALFIVGALTPILCAICCCLEIFAMFGLRGTDALYMLCSIVDTAALGFLGPGGYSLDARMFGRRRVVLSTNDRSDLL